MQLMLLNHHDIFDDSRPNLQSVAPVPPLMLLPSSVLLSTAPLTSKLPETNESESDDEPENLKPKEARPLVYDVQSARRQTLVPKMHRHQISYTGKHLTT